MIGKLIDPLVHAVMARADKDEHDGIPVLLHAVPDGTIQELQIVFQGTASAVHGSQIKRCQTGCIRFKEKSIAGFEPQCYGSKDRNGRSKP